MTLCEGETIARIIDPYDGNCLKEVKSPAMQRTAIMNTRKPIIGLIPLVDDERDSYWMLPGYMKGIEQAGGIPVMLPLTSDQNILQQICDACDGLLFTGGHDVSPYLYGESPIPQCGQWSEERDAMESTLLRMAIASDKAVLGICRGIQLINAVLGGTLYQDLPTQHPSNIEHHMTAPYNRGIHHVRIVKHTPLYSLLNIDTLSVNSYHHQAVKDLAPCLTPMAYSEDGLVEAVHYEGKRYIQAFQWHPEFSYNVDQCSRAIFQDFVQRAVRKL